MGAALDRDILKMDEIRRLEALQIQNNEEVAANDARNAAIREQRLEDARAPLRENEAPDSHPYSNDFRGDFTARMRHPNHTFTII